MPICCGKEMEYLDHETGDRISGDGRNTPFEYEVLWTSYRCKECGKVKIDN